jgi:indole-3-glycerol phosphate synthase
MFLEKMVAIKRGEIFRKKDPSRLRELKKKAEGLPPPRDFERAILQDGSMALIAEIKKASPSGGVIRWEADIPKMAREYEGGGACALSVLTESHFFHGEMAHLPMVKESVGLPLLQKDFIIDPFQLYEGRIAGADAILLIAAILSRGELLEFVKLARCLGLFPLVEVHGEEDLEKISGLGLSLFGINNRNLKTLEVNLETTDRLIGRVPRGMKVISESGIRDRRDVERLEKAGVRGILVGEVLMRASDPASKIKELLNL